MNFPQVTQWDEKRMNVSEKMKVLKPFRFNKEGKILKKKPGDNIEVSGSLKKDLYHQLKICYPQDEKAINEYFAAQRKNGAPSEYSAPPNLAKKVDVDELVGQVATLSKQVDALKKQNEELSAKKGGK